MEKKNNIIGQRKKIIDLLQEAVKNEGNIDAEKTKIIISSDFTKSAVNLGIIPEHLSVGSSHEKIWSKIGDILLTVALDKFDFNPEAIAGGRGAARVVTDNGFFTTTWDLKAFRLSRTAKNQKDFKVSALNDSRGNNSFAVLVSPEMFFPAMRSLIYQQAQKNKVILLSLEQLSYIAKYDTKCDLIRMWNFVKGIDEENGTSAEGYWQGMDKLIVDMTSTKPADLERHKATIRRGISEISAYESDYLQAETERIRNMSRKELIAEVEKTTGIGRRLNKIQELKILS